MIPSQDVVLAPEASRAAPKKVARLEWRCAPDETFAPIEPGVCTADLETWILVQVAYELGLDPLDLDAEAELRAYGFCGTSAETLASRLARHLGRDLPADLFEIRRTASDVAEHLAGADRSARRSIGFRFVRGAGGCPLRVERVSVPTPTTSPR